ncbi:hypothetical protein B0H19DRAFT_1055285 [Mycena capillaripes]|nr:hypothetical protein B0H19DRAFT_1055285 [Mycena capillaripes]
MDARSAESSALLASFTHFRVVDGMLSTADGSVRWRTPLSENNFLCSASQQILLRFLTLKGHIYPPNYIEASILFTESPHLGAYVTDVKIELPSEGTYAEAIVGLPKVLEKLTRVRRCVVEGPPDSAEHKLGFSSELVDFVSRQPLEFLSVRAVRGISPTVFKSLLISVPALSFCDVELSESICDDDDPTFTPAVTDLVLDKGTKDILEALTPTEQTVYTSSLRRLSMRFATGLPLLVAAARTLQHIRIGSPITSESQDPTPRLNSLPSLPFFTSLELELDYKDHSAEWVNDTIVAILRAKDEPEFLHLKEIIITYLPVWHWNSPNDGYVAFLTSLDQRLSSHSPCPCLRWRVRFVGAGREEHLNMLSAFTEQHMARLHAMGHLVFETYEPLWRDGFQWRATVLGILRREWIVSDVFGTFMRNAAVTVEKDTMHPSHSNSELHLDQPSPMRFISGLQ